MTTEPDPRLDETGGPTDEPIEDSLRPRVAAGVRWGATDQTVQVVVRFAASVVMARLLDPSDLGLFALALVVANLADLIVGLGLSDALIQRRDLEPADVRTAFTLSTLSGLALTVAIIVGRDALGRLLGDPDVVPVLVALSVIVVISSVERTPNDMLIRALQMREFYLSSTIATVVSAVVGIAVAVAGGGVWSLVAMALAEAVLATILAWTFALRARVWRPGWGFERARARRLVRFGMAVTGGRIAGYGQSNLDNFVVGRNLGAVELGYYSLAYRTVLLPIVKVSEMLGSSAFAAFAGVQHDLPRLRRGVRQANRYIAVVCLPATLGLAVTAELFVPLVFGDQWRPAIRAVELLALVGPALSFSRLDYSLYKALGRPSIALRISSAQLATAIPAIIIGVHWGIEGVAVSVVLLGYAWLPVVFMIRARLLEQGLGEQVRPLVPIMGATVLMALVALGVREVATLHLGDGASLVLTVVAGTLAYLVTLRAVDPGLVHDALADVRRTAR